MVLGIDASRAVAKEKTGVEWYSYFLLRAMEKVTPVGWNVRCYVPSTEHEVWGLPAQAGMKHGTWEWKVLRWIGRGWTQGRLSLEMMKSPPDVLFVPSHAIPLVHPERTVTTVHDVVFVQHPELYAPQDLEDQKRGLDFALKFAKKIIVPSKATRDGVVAAGGKPEQIAVVPHGVDIPWNMEHETCSIPQQPYLFFIGRIEKKKNVMNLIHAFRNVQSDVKLVLAGSNGYGAEDVSQAIKTFKLEGRVISLGWVERAQYLHLLDNASLLIVPSLGEGFGMPVAEAMASGTPVVCADIPVLREVGGNAVQYMNPGDAHDIARSIDSVLQNEMLQTEMVRRGKERAAQYSWDKAARETWRVIESL